ncbi:hypothetical protein [Hydrogenovibrio kuenenii]|uniref:hypothetical protein n=1 Tax=Hydrogenovibrio kuenenii TaxID=63658 RepID=UPI0012FEC16C|nr:hypothetical protein [Hydrogenovibrio kuenenii]
MMLLILATIVSMILLYFIAEKRGADTLFWVVMGLFFRAFGNSLCVLFKTKTWF